MTSRSDRGAALRQFAVDALVDPQLEIAPASADASFRSYWRTRSNQGSHIVMDAPPAQEDMTAWLDVGARLRAAGLHAPQVLAVDDEHGFALIEDLGNRTYLPELNGNTVDQLYSDALDALIHMQIHVDVAGLPHYTETRLIDELELMPQWFLKAHLDFVPSCEQWDVIEAAFLLLVKSALGQPSAFVHRDFHSRNLLVTPSHSPGIIDFQDAVIGPITYDLVSLLRDCYIEWDEARVEGWMESHRERLLHAHLIGPEIDNTRLRRWFDLMGLQRHIKVLGIFCRLWYRDGKPQYLADLALVWRYVIEVGQRYPELQDFISLLQHVVGTRDIVQPASTANAP